MDNNLASFFRMALAAVGAFLIGKSFHGVTITSDYVNTTIGIVLELGSLIWGIVTKSAPIEKWQSFIRNVGSFAGGFFVAAGKLSADTLEMIIGAAVSLAAFIASYLSKKKSQQIATNQIAVASLVKPGTAKPAKVA